MKTPKPNGQRCAHCGLPIHDHEACVASKPKGCRYWVFSHFDCAYPKKKKADTGVRFK
ncbi:MAG: hypothetical protein J6B99_09600 [Oscillospiraceae bacterium]|nr:hypothetical protein [Oscillospiraceae bacterium]